MMRRRVMFCGRFALFRIVVRSPRSWFICFITFFKKLKALEISRVVVFQCGMTDSMTV